MIDAEIMEKARLVVNKLGEVPEYDVDDLHAEYGIDDEALGELVVQQVQEAMSSGEFLQIPPVASGLGAGLLTGFELGVIAARMELAGGEA